MELQKDAEKHRSRRQEPPCEPFAPEMPGVGRDGVQARLLDLLGKSSSFIATATADGTLLYVNPSARAMLQWGDGKLSTRCKIFECLTPEANQALLDEALPAARREGVWAGPAELQGRAGRRLSTSLQIIVHRNADGQDDGFSLLAQDLTARLQSEAALRHAQEASRRLSAELLKAQEAERQRVAAELHDVIGQALSLTKLSIDNAAEMIGQGASDHAREALRDLSARVKEALVKARKISMELHPATLDDLGILPTLSWYFREFEAAGHDITLIKAITVAENEIPVPLRTTIFRLLQEAIGNSVKHAGADRIRVGLSRQADLLQLTVADNGRGFDARRHFTDGGTGNGLGLRSMQERARLSGGSCVVESGVGQGTSIRIAWPGVGTMGG